MRLRDRFWFWLRKPTPPVNVVLIMAGGRRWPVEVVYDGYRDGVDHWAVTTYLSNVDPGEVIGLTADALPGRSALHFYGSLPDDVA